MTISRDEILLEQRVNEMVTLILTKPLHIESFLDPEAPLSQQFMEGLFAPVAPWLPGVRLCRDLEGFNFCKPNDHREHV